MGLSKAHTVESISAYTWKGGMFLAAPAPASPARMVAGVISQRTGFSGGASCCGRRGWMSVMFVGMNLDIFDTILFFYGNTNTPIHI